MSNDVQIVIDKAVLDVIHPLPGEKFSKFFVGWLTENGIKPTIAKSYYEQYETEWRTNLKGNSDEIRHPFFARLKGLVAKYEEDSNCNDPINATLIIVDRHYATCKFLVVGNVSHYNLPQVLGAKCVPIMTLSAFYNHMEINDPASVKDITDTYGPF